MTSIVPNEGEVVLLEAAVGKTAAGTITLKLFTNNYTPTDTDTTASYTEMAAVQGYVAKSLTTAGWNAAVAGTGTGTTTPAQASITYPQQTFTFDGTGGSVTVYGYYGVSAGGKVVMAETFATSQTIVNNGDFIKITPTLFLSRQ